MGDDTLDPRWASLVRRKNFTDLPLSKVEQILTEQGYSESTTAHALQWFIDAREMIRDIAKKPTGRTERTVFSDLDAFAALGGVGQLFQRTGRLRFTLRLWRTFGLQSHRLETFKLSADSVRVLEHFDVPQPG